MRTFRRVLFLSTIICNLFYGLAFAGSFTWDVENYAPVGFWGEADHWGEPNHYPHWYDDIAAIYGKPAKLTIPPIPPIPAQAAEVTLDFPVYLNALTIGPPVEANPNRLFISGLLDMRESPDGVLPAINNEGVIDITGGLGSTAETKLEGSGKITLYKTTQNYSGGAISGIFRNKLTIEGAGTIGGILYNEGTVRATFGQKLSIAADTFNSGGILTTDGASDLDIAGDVAGGAIDHNGGKVRFLSMKLTNVSLSGGLSNFDGSSEHMMVPWPYLLFAGHNEIMTSAVLSSKGEGCQTADSIRLELLNFAKLENNGTIRLESTGCKTALLVPNESTTVGRTATLEGHGKLVLAGSSNHVETDPHSSLEHGPNHTIEGVGLITGNITNKGLIMAKDGELTLLDADMVNSGNLASSPGGVLALKVNSSIMGGISVSGEYASKISPNGGLVTLEGAAITNGEWRPGNIQFKSGSLLGNNWFTPGTTVDFIPGANVTIPGSQMITNDGILRLNGNAFLKSGIQNTANATFAQLTGTGKLFLVGAASGYFTNYPTLESLSLPSNPSGFINDPTHTIQGAGTLNAPIINYGTIVVENGPLKVCAPITGNGTIQVSDTGTLWPSCLSGNIQTGNLVMSKNAVFNNSENRTMTLGGYFKFFQNDEASWKLYPPSLRFNGQGPIQNLEVGGENMGLNYSGFISNFHLKSMILQGQDTLVNLVDGIDNGNRSQAPEALYVEDLQVPSGTTLNLNGIALYKAITSQPYTYRVKAGDGSIFGGGSIIDVLPVSLLPPPPISPSIPTGTTNVPLMPILSWQGNWPGTVTFDLYIWKSGENRPVTPTMSGLTSYSYSLPNALNANTGYSWQVMVTDKRGSSESEIWSFTTGTGEVKPGDINGDKIVNLNDAVIALQILAGKTTTQMIKKDNGVSGNGKVCLVDVIYILQKVAGMRQ